MLKARRKKRKAFACLLQVQVFIFTSVSYMYNICFFYIHMYKLQTSIALGSFFQKGNPPKILRHIMLAMTVEQLRPMKSVHCCVNICEPEMLLHIFYPFGFVGQDLACHLKGLTCGTLAVVVFHGRHRTCHKLLCRPLSRCRWGWDLFALMQNDDFHMKHGSHT